MPNNARRYIVFIAMFLTIFLLFHIRDQRENLACDFRGIVQKVSYDSNGTKVTIKGHVYELNGDYDFGHKINVGDYLIKRQGSTIYRLVKYEKPKVLTFDIE